MLLRIGQGCQHKIQMQHVQYILTISSPCYCHACKAIAALYCNSTYRQ
jgi:hypothetical protein